MLRYGVGINDADYKVCIKEELPKANGKRKFKVIFQCPFYDRWSSMLTRCYSESYKNRFPSYANCFVVEEWLTFSKFKAWMETQDWEGKQLDKDLLFPGNKVYSPETCVFLKPRVNYFIMELRETKSTYPVGVTYDKIGRKWVAQCSSPEKRIRGTFKTAKEAHEGWLKFKLSLAYALAKEESDKKVAEALVNRYLNYKDWYKHDMLIES